MSAFTPLGGTSSSTSILLGVLAILLVAGPAWASPRHFSEIDEMFDPDNQVGLDADVPAPSEDWDRLEDRASAALGRPRKSRPRKKARPKFEPWQDPAPRPSAARRVPGPESVGGTAFDPAVAGSAQSFVSLYADYTRAVDSAFDARVQKLTGDTSYSELTRARKAAAGANSMRYRAAMSAATAHVQDFKQTLADSVDPASTYLLIKKSTYLLFLMDRARGRALAVFPIAYGIHPDQGPKTAPGDLRSPECPSGSASPESTPFYAAPLVDKDPAADKGCITRGIGVTSADAAYDYLDGWTVMIHGTPYPDCMGTRASHGCIRMLPAHIRILFDQVQEGAPIVFVF